MYIFIYVYMSMINFTSVLFYCTYTDFCFTTHTHTAANGDAPTRPMMNGTLRRFTLHTPH